MKIFYFVVAIFIFSFVSNLSYGQDHVLLQLKDNKRFVIATEYGVEVYSYGLTRLGKAKGSGNVPVDLELKRGEHCFVLTEKTLDYFYVNVHGGTAFRATVPLEKENPTDMEFLNKGKEGQILVVYKSGMQNFYINWHSHSVEITPGRSINSVGAIP